MIDLTFEWDEEKAGINLRKHGITFDEAKTVFNDALAVTIHDPEHSTSEHRYIDIGRSSSGRILVVVYTERGTNIRLISSRLAAKAERRTYEEGRF